MTPKHHIILGLVSLFAVVAAGFSVSQYMENRSLTARLSALERQISSVATTLAVAGTESAENARQLEELANRSALAARSQEDLLTEAVGRSSPAVVSVVISKNAPLLEVEYVNPFGDDPMFRDVGYRVPVFRQVGTRPEQVGAGTGFIVHSEGYIVTNRHVVEERDVDYTVLLSSGEKKNARVVHRDDRSDVGILKIEGEGYPTIPLGDSADLKLGQTVAAIGNALGEYNNSVSVGIISGLNRTVDAYDADGTAETLSGVVQTDAAINSGNSGGPLLDLSGKAVGINVAIQRGAANIAFAIPIDAVKPIVEEVVP